MDNSEYEWMAMSEWLKISKNKDPAEEGWEFEWGALRRKKDKMAVDRLTVNSNDGGTILSPRYEAIDNT
jgi:hypothetical protein